MLEIDNPRDNKLKNKITILLLTTLIAAIGGIGTHVIESYNKQKEYIGELHRNLYNKESEALDKVDSAYDELYSLYSKGYAFSTYELEPQLNKWREAIESYEKYIKELERFGNTSEVQTAKNLNEWLLDIHIRFVLQHKLAEQIQCRAKELLLIKYPKSDQFKFVNAALDSDLDHFMNSENRIYYDIGHYQKPVVDGLTQYLNYQFRTAIGLEATYDMGKTIKELPNLAKRKADTVYSDSKIPFVFAEQRAVFAPTMEIKVKDAFFEQKNLALKNDVKMKFLALVIKNDKELQIILKSRKAASQKGR